MVLPDSVSLRFRFEVVILVPWAGGSSGKKAAPTAEGAPAELGRAGGLSGADLGRLLSAGRIVSPQQIFPRCCYKASIWQITAGLRAPLSPVKRQAGTADVWSKSELTIKISLEIAAR